MDTGRGGLGPPADPGSADIPVEGVTPLDHTADVGFEVEAPDLAELVRRAIFAMDWLLREEADPPAVAEDRVLDVAASTPPILLRGVLREVLLWHERDGFAPTALDDVRASPTRVEARVLGGVPEHPPVREIKGVTLHALAAEPRGPGWWGRVVFDV